MGGLPLKDQVGGDKAAPRLEKPSEQWTGDRVGRIGDDSKRASWEAQVGGVGLHNRDLASRELAAERPCPSPVQLDGDDPSADSNQRGGHRARSGADVEDELAGPHPCFSDESTSPGGVELVPPPPARAGGHGAPSP